MSCDVLELSHNASHCPSYRSNGDNSIAGAVGMRTRTVIRARTIIGVKYTVAQSPMAAKFQLGY